MHPNGFKIGEKMGYGNHTGEDFEVPLDYFIKGAGRKEYGDPIHVELMNNINNIIPHRHILHATIIEKVKNNHYKAWLSTQYDY